MIGQQIATRIKDLCQARSWTVCRLAKESGITYSTLCTMLNETAVLSAEEKQHLSLWRKLKQANRNAVDKYIAFLLSEQGNC